MQPEETKSPDQKGGHEDVGPVKKGVLFLLRVVGVGIITDKLGRGCRVTFLTGGEEVGRMGPGAGVPAGENVMVTMAV